MKKVVRISSIDQIGGRVLISAPDVVDGTIVHVHLDGSADAWGTGVIEQEQAHIVGLGALPDQYSLTLSVQALNTELLPAQ